MTNSPIIKTHRVSDKELERLYAEHGMEEKLSHCHVEPLCEPQSLMHQTFCCKREGCEYIDPATGDSIAIIFVYTKANAQKTTFRVIRMLRVGDNIYDAAFNSK